tara:strand:- start:70 stop:549 length:480 start_codon:yes stop_codon:yes gene_type:complete
MASAYLLDANEHTLASLEAKIATVASPIKAVNQGLAGSGFSSCAFVLKPRLIAYATAPPVQWNAYFFCVGVFFASIVTKAKVTVANVEAMVRDHERCLTPQTIELMQLPDNTHKGSLIALLEGSASSGLQLNNGPCNELSTFDANLVNISVNLWPSWLE